jgi:RND family efflux transporter MFP subunit
MSPDRQTLEELRIHRPTTSRSPSPGRIGLVVLALGVVAALVFWWLHRPQLLAVHMATAQKVSGTSRQTLLNASGYVTARRQATVASKVTGKVTEALVEEGMKVQGGQILARVDPSNVEKSLKLSEAQLQAARKALDETVANLDRAERELRRSAELAKVKITSVSVLDQAEADAKSLRAHLEKQQADVAVAERDLATWQQQLDDTIIRAPFAGIVTSKNAQPGEMISPMSAGGTGSFTRTGICTLVDMDSLEIEVDVSESYINRVESGQRVEAILDAYPEWHIPAKVIAIIPSADRQKATVKVRVGFDALDPRILPDMGVKVAFQGNESGRAAAQTVTLPKAAIQQRDGKDIVWLVKQDGVERRAVTVSAAQNDQATVIAGLSGGERVVVDPPLELVEGTRVKELKP